MFEKAEARKPVEVRLCTDGACSGNPGPGGWAFILTHLRTGKTLEMFGAEEHTTNNRMELRAVIEGLKRLKRRTRVHVVTDSSYVMKGATLWRHNWKRLGWRRKGSAGYEPVKNVDLWQELETLIDQHDVTFELVAGHAGHEENERCDKLAVEAYKPLIKSRSSGSLENTGQ
jgi:ribonuclease HI